MAANRVHARKVSGLEVSGGPCRQLRAVFCECVGLYVVLLVPRDQRRFVIARVFDLRRRLGVY